MVESVLKNLVNHKARKRAFKDFFNLLTCAVKDRSQTWRGNIRLQQVIFDLVPSPGLPSRNIEASFCPALLLV